MTLKSGDILCFYEVKNPIGGIAGFPVKFHSQTSLDNYVEWAQDQSESLPSGHVFHQAIWVKIAESRLKDPYIPQNLTNGINSDGSIMVDDDKWWLEHIFTLESGYKDQLSYLFDEEE